MKVFTPALWKLLQLGPESSLAPNPARAHAPTGRGIYLYNATGVCGTAEANNQRFPAPRLVFGVR